MKKILIGFLSLVLTLGVMAEINANEKPPIGENPFGWPHVHANIPRNSPHTAVIGWIYGEYGYVCSGTGSGTCTMF